MDMELYNRLTDMADKDHYTRDDLDMIIKGSRDEAAAIRASAAELLVSSGCIEAKQALLRLAEDPDELVRINACDSLGSFPGADTEAVLKRHAEYDDSELARAYSVLSLNDIIDHEGRSSGNIDLFRRLIQKDGSGFVHTAACAAMYSLKYDEYLEGLLSDMHDEYYGIRCFAARTVKSIINKDNIPVIEQNIKELAEKEESEAVLSALKELSDSIKRSR